MTYILDTHAFIWYAVGDKRLSDKARSIIDSNSEKYISIASIWEMSIKVGLGKLTFKKPFEEIIEHQITINNYKILSIESSHLYALSQLEMYHRDPFDRIILCQSLVENIPVISVDKSFRLYEEVDVIW